MLSNKNLGVLPASVEQIHEALAIVRKPHVVVDELFAQVTPLVPPKDGYVTCLTPFGVHTLKVEELKNYTRPE